MAMTPGANRTKQAQIYRLMTQGFTADQISRQVKVYKNCVEHFMKHFSDPKNLPKTSAMSAIKEGLPRVPGQGITLDESRVENRALLARIEALEAANTVMPMQTTGDDDDGLG